MKSFYDTFIDSLMLLKNETEEQNERNSLFYNSFWKWFPFVFKTPSIESDVDTHQILSDPTLWLSLTEFLATSYKIQNPESHHIPQ